MSTTPDQNSAITPPPPPADLNRRSILAGAAWTIPAIAVASVAPAAAASTAPVLTFDKSTYNGTACGTISGAYVTVTVGGVPTVGKSVTTTLSSGYTFSGGSSTDTQTSGSDGRVTLPSINVPSQGGSGTITAVAAGAAGHSSLSTPNASSRLFGGSWDNNAFAALPAGVTATKVGYQFANNTVYAQFLGNDGYLYQSVNYGTWSKISPAGVTTFYTSSGGGAVYTTGNSVGGGWNQNAFPALPSGITAIEVSYQDTGLEHGRWGNFLGSDGAIYQSLNFGAWKKVSPTGVTAWFTGNTGNVIFSLGNKVGGSWDNNAFAALPAGVTATKVGYQFANNTVYAQFLGNDGYLYQSVNYGTWSKISPAGVTTFYTSSGGGAVYTTGNSVGGGWNQNAFPALPSGITAIEVSYQDTGLEHGRWGNFLGSDGAIYQSLNFGAWKKVSPTGVTAWFTGDTGNVVFGLQSSC